MTLDEIKAGLRANAFDLARHLFPQGRRNGKEWKTGDVTGSEGKSFSICIQGIKAGTWCDFGTGEKGTLIDLWAMNRGYHGTEGWVVRAGEECAEWLGHHFEKRGADPQQNTTQNHTPKKGPTPLTRRITPPRNFHQEAPPPPPPMPSYEDKWEECVAALDDKSAEKFAKSRGISVEGVEWLRSMKLIGLHDTRHGRAFAFPVHDENGIVIAAHVRNRTTNAADGKTIDPPPPKWQYFYHGDTSPGTRPWIIGNLATAKKVWIFESQYDAIAVLDRMGMLRTEAEWPHIAALITRGASNGGLAGRAALEGKTLVLWPQNDEPHPKTKKIAAEEWVKAILEIAGGFPVRRVKTPDGFDDPNDWLQKQPEIDDSKILETITQAVPARSTKLPPMRDMAFAIKPENRTPIPGEVIKGILHKGSKLVVGGTSKGKKSWTLLDLAVSVSSGTPWWGFPTVQGRVLYINFEIQQAFFEGRAAVVAQAKEVTLGAGTFMSMTLRGSTEAIENLADEIIAYILDMEPFALIILDPVYKLMAGRDENKAGDVTAVLNQIERVAVQTGAAIAIGAHFSKGNQAGKDSIDRIGGSGAFARDPDAILIMTAHEESDAFTIEATLRNFPPTDPFVVRWEFPLFVRDNSLDPAALKLPKKAGFAQSGGESSRFPTGATRKNDRLVPALAMMAAIWTQLPRASRYGDFLDSAQKRVTDDAGEPLKERTAKAYFGKLKEDGYIQRDPAGGPLWVTTEKGDAYLDGLAAPKPEEPKQPELI